MRRYRDPTSLPENTARVSGFNLIEAFLNSYSEQELIHSSSHPVCLENAATGWASSKTSCIQLEQEHPTSAELQVIRHL
jgi:hypothetical protein